MNDITFNLQKYKDLIDGTGLSHPKLSELIGIDSSLINRHYNGDKNRPISVYYLEKYCKFFNVTPNYFYDLEDNELTEKEKEHIVCKYTGLNEETIEKLNYAFIDKNINNSKLYNTRYKDLYFLTEFVENNANHNLTICSEAYVSFANTISCIYSIKSMIEYIVKDFDFEKFKSYIGDKSDEDAKYDIEALISFIQGWEREYKFQIFNSELSLSSFADNKLFENYSYEYIFDRLEQIENELISYL